MYKITNYVQYKKKQLYPPLKKNQTKKYKTTPSPRYTCNYVYENNPSGFFYLCGMFDHSCESFKWLKFFGKINADQLHIQKRYPQIAIFLNILKMAPKWKRYYLSITKKLTYRHLPHEFFSSRDI